MSIPPSRGVWPLNAELFDWAFRFVLHLIAGALAVVVHVTIMAIALKGDVPPVAATSLGFCGGALTRFVTTHFHVFDHDQTAMMTLPRFLVVIMIQGAANAGFLALLVRAGMGTWWAQAIVTMSLTIGTYLAYRLWVFRRLEDVIASPDR
jgi:putative flippase GtrA